MSVVVSGRKCSSCFLAPRPHHPPGSPSRGATVGPQPLFRLRGVSEWIVSRATRGTRETTLATRRANGAARAREGKLNPI